MAATDLFPDALDWDEWLARRAAAAAPHASPSLIAAALPAIAPHCTCRELVRLTAACHELRKVEQLPIDFSVQYKKDAPSQFIRFIKQHGRRFLISKLTTWCLQEDFDCILKSAIGLQKLKCTSANRAMVSLHTQFSRMDCAVWKFLVRSRPLPSGRALSSQNRGSTSYSTRGG